MCTDCKDEEKWYVLRDLKRPNATFPAYKVLAERGVRVFTPMTTCITKLRNKTIKERVPYVHGLLFAYGTRENLDPIIESIHKLQYRYLKGHFHEPMVVPTFQMECFIRAVETCEKPKYLLPEELKPSMYGARVIIKGGPMDGQECRLLSIRGSKTKRILVEIPTLIAVGIEVQDFEYLVIPVESEQSLQ